MKSIQSCRKLTQSNKVAQESLKIVNGEKQKASRKRHQVNICIGAHILPW